jgi:ribonuclease P protein component
MLSRPSRLQHAADIATVFKQGRRVPCGPIVLLITSNHLRVSRFGCLAGKKIFPLATERNTAKRIAREAIRFVSSRVRPGYDILVVYRARPQARSVARFAQALEETLEQQGLLPSPVIAKE